MGFSRQEYWSGLPLPSLGNLPDPGIEPRSPASQTDALTSEPPGEPYDRRCVKQNWVRILPCCSCVSIMPLGLSGELLCLLVARTRAKCCPFAILVMFPFQFSSVAQSCPTLCNPMNRSTPGLPVHHQLPEFTQTHVHWVGSAIQPSHPLSSPFPPALNLSQHQGLFKWVSSSHQLAKVLEFQLQHQSYQWTPRTDLLYFFIIFFHEEFYFIYLFFPFIFISWRLITLQYCSGFCHTLTWTDWISLQSKGLSGIFSNTTVQKHQFFCTQLSL